MVRLFCDTRVGIEAEIKDLEDILKLSDQFQEVYDLIEPTNQDKLKNERNKSDFAYEVGELKDIREKILSGEIEAGTDRTWKSKSGDNGMTSGMIKESFTGASEILRRRSKWKRR